ncbi:DUF1330 domain-containing protein [Planomonospora sp. ID91781]|uniref:DUF1330 domain-containing protein n=1 Tax=Planomonospora sphaerica TaxID=161355 RepID=A0A161LM14_9ACTN|nr:MULTISPECIES: DUF1330 domain-containing protein [Planomonospora]MBG0824552.1 DUF1330 domain-containing protein [Planomonospora sp. ID91781]GAT68185.1 hypothetical protein PS9374_03846 [Planomonospora sphaerica]
MTAYVIAHLRDPEELHPEVLEYMEGIQATMDPFSGRFVVHGGAVDVREGRWPGNVVMLEFPSVENARDWYESAAYREILPLRTDHLEGDLIIVEGVGPGYDPATKAAELRKAL